MDGQNGTHRIAQDLSTLVASVLPILQLFFTQLPPSVQSIFLASDKFVGISVITLILSYVLIIAFQAKPWFEITLPFQGKKIREYKDYLRKVNEVSAAANFVTGEQASAAKITKFLDNLDKNKPKNEPYKIKRDNIIGLGVTIVLVAAVVFIVTSFIRNLAWAAAIQSIMYVLLVVFSVLVLSVYRNTVGNSQRYENESQTKTNRALELAIQHNVFGILPQPRLVESFEDGGYPGNLNIVVEHDNNYYHIVTDSRGVRLFRARKLDSYQE